MAQFLDALSKLASESGIAQFFTGSWQNLVMIVVACGLLWLGIKKGFEPLLMVPIAFGMLLANLPGANLAVHYHDIPEFIQLIKGQLVDPVTHQKLTAGLLDWLYLGVKAGIYPPLIFLGIGADRKSVV